MQCKHREDLCFFFLHAGLKVILMAMACMQCKRRENLFFFVFNSLIHCCSFIVLILLARDYDEKVCLVTLVITS